MKSTVILGVNSIKPPILILPPLAGKPRTPTACKPTTSNSFISYRIIARRM